jgi:hypothetical protein
MQWFRMHHEVLDDPKVQTLGGELFKHWVNVLALTCRCGGRLPALRQIAFALRLTIPQAERVVEQLKDAGLIDELDGELAPHNWSGRQYAKAASTLRVQRLRERRRNGESRVAETHDQPVAGNDPLSETESENRISSPLGSPPAAKRGTRLPQDWTLPDDWLAWSRDEGLSEAQARREADRFRDYFHAASGQKAVKSDWKAAWRNWVRQAVDHAEAHPARRKSLNTVAG